MTQNERKAKRGHKGREGWDLSFTDSFPKYPQKLGLGQITARILELHSGIPCVW